MVLDGLAIAGLVGFGSLITDFTVGTKLFGMFWYIYTVLDIYPHSRVDIHTGRVEHGHKECQKF